MFEQYTSFLEVAFGVNLLLGAWDGLYDKLSKLDRDSESRGERTLAHVDADGDRREAIKKHHRRCESLHIWIRRIGRTVGILIALAVGVALLVVDPKREVEAWGFGLIAGTGLLVPLLMAVMVGMDLLLRRVDQTQGGRGCPRSRGWANGRPSRRGQVRPPKLPRRSSP